MSEPVVKVPADVIPAAAKPAMPEAHHFLIDTLRNQRNNMMEECGQLGAQLNMARLSGQRLEVELAELKVSHAALEAKVKGYEEAKDAAVKAIETAAAPTSTASADGAAPASDVAQDQSTVAAASM